MEMEQIVESHELVKRFLLGQLAEEEHAMVEERIFTDQESFRELLVVETELIDDFVFGTPSDDEQERMEKHFFVDPERVENLKITKAIERYVSKTSHSPDLEWEDTLREAEKNRRLLGLLMSEDWAGLRLLALLEASSRSLEELAAAVNKSSYEVTSVLSQLVESGLADGFGDRFSCTGWGVESLQRIERASR
jgi:hypothetical protein